MKNQKVAPKKRTEQKWEKIACQCGHFFLIHTVRGCTAPRCECKEKPENG